jgi:hypothetical protein
MSLLTQASLVLTPTSYKANKLYSVVPSSGNGDLTTTRATTATRVNSSGLVENVATGIPRVDYTSGVANILLEPQRTNRLLNSATVVTQTISTTGVACTVSFYGTGTITFSGTFSGSLVGTGVSNRVSLTFTPTSGNLFLTVSGTCTNGQLENGSYATSYIPTTTSTVTRNEDLASVSGVTSLIGQTEGVMFFESAALSNDLTARLVSISDGTTSNRIVLIYDSSSNLVSAAMVSAGTLVIPSINYTIADETQFIKMAVRYSNTLGVSLWINGVNRASSIVTTLPISMNRFSFDRGTSGSNTFYGKVKSAQLYKTYLTDAEMVSLTTL